MEDMERLAGREASQSLPPCFVGIVAMHCPCCETPIMKAPGYGLYCPNLECAWHDEGSVEEFQMIATYELERRARAGPVVFGMPQAEWLRLFNLNLDDLERRENRRG
jgi:hypothetical protein